MKANYSELLLFIPFFLCWGSFLNVLAYRLIKGQSIITPRSFCPSCKTLIHWYDNIPIFSWFILQGRCRTCHQKISFLYPLIESLTALLLCLLYSTVSHHYFFAYFIFFSALIVTIRSDIETMLISSFVTTFLVPIAFIMSTYHFLPLSLPESIAGALFGYFFLFIINKTFKYLRNIDGVGEGDFHLLFFIGSFTGIIGCWISVTIASMLGSLYGLFLCIMPHYNSNMTSSIKDTKIPFGPFLAFGAILFILTQKYIFYYITTN